MAIYYDYVLAVWLNLETATVEGEFASELQEHLEAEYSIHKLEIIEVEEPATEGEATVSLQLQLTFVESEMEDNEPTVESLVKLSGELRSHLEAKYHVSCLNILDDALTTYLLDVYDDGVDSSNVDSDKGGPEVEGDSETEAEPNGALTWFDDSDSEVVAIARDFARSLLRQDCIQPHDIVGIGRALHALGRLPLSTAEEQNTGTPTFVEIFCLAILYTPVYNLFPVISWRVADPGTPNFQSPGLSPLKKWVSP